MPFITTSWTYKNTEVYLIVSKIILQYFLKLYASIFCFWKRVEPLCRYACVRLHANVKQSFQRIHRTMTCGVPIHTMQERCTRSQSRKESRWLKWLHDSSLELYTLHLTYTIGQAGTSVSARPQAQAQGCTVRLAQVPGSGICSVRWFNWFSGVATVIFCNSWGKDLRLFVIRRRPSV